jgi:hypothetical protein
MNNRKEARQALRAWATPAGIAKAGIASRTTSWQAKGAMERQESLEHEDRPGRPRRAAIAVLTRKIVRAVDNIPAQAVQVLASRIGEPRSTVRRIAQDKLDCNNFSKTRTVLPEAVSDGEQHLAECLTPERMQHE